MRLIDADLLKKDLRGHSTLNVLLASIIDCQHTVDAIPRERIDEMIAAIKDRRSKHNCSCSDCLDIIDEYTKEQNNE